MKGFYITVKNGLLDKKHREQMGESVWLFMWLLDKITSVSEEGVGKVLGGRPIKYKELKVDLGLSRSTYIRYLNLLSKYNYINTTQAPYGLIITVNKSKKVFGQRVVKNDTSIDVAKMTPLVSKNDTSNKTRHFLQDTNNTKKTKFSSKIKKTYDFVEIDWTHPYTKRNKYQGKYKLFMGINQKIYGRLPEGGEFIELKKIIENEKV